MIPAARDRLPLGLARIAAALVLGLACSRAEAPPPPAEPAPEPAAAARADAPSASSDGAEVSSEATPRGTVIAKARTPDGREFEAEYGRKGSLPSNFPDDVPIYASAQPVGSFSAAEYGTVVNLHASDPPERVYDWYRQRFVEQGWELEQEIAKHSRHIVAARKGNRVASVVITGVPELTQVLVTVGEDR